LPVLDSDPYLIRMQDEHGLGEVVSAIMRAAESDCSSSTATAEDDAGIGTRGRPAVRGSDGFSGVTCNPAVGYAADLLVRAGATVMFSEVTECATRFIC